MNGRRRGDGDRLTERLSARLQELSWFDRALRRARSKAFPDHWSLLFGQVAVYSFIIVTVTGIFLMFFYDASTTLVRYDGSFTPLHGVEMSRALESTLQISFDVRGGLLVRQLHNWSASLMIAALMAHILRIFFTGGFRKPRKLRWLVLFGILFLSWGAGLTGAVLPDDLLSGSTLAVLDGVLKAIPIIGTWASYLVFSGEFPSGAIALFYPLHILLLPLAIAGAMLLNGLLAMVNGPEQFPGPGRKETNIVGRPLTVAAVKGGGLFFLVAGLLTAIAAGVTVNPVWAYGPADPGNASAGAGALWYVAFLDGAQRLTPPGWELVWLDRTWTLAILVPVGLVGLYLLAAALYPFLEAWVTGDRRSHHLLDRPRNAPARTAIGAAGVTVYGVLWAAAGSDVIAMRFGLSVESVVLALQVTLLLGPLIAYVGTKRTCLALQKKDRAIVMHGVETGRIVRLPGGGYAEKHTPVDVHRRPELVDYEAPAPLVLRPDGDGRIRFRNRVRAVMSRWLYADRVPPVRAGELEAAPASEQEKVEAGRP
ncbi:cytochrome bc complex cytochrome b subunit [Lysobacter korlensis]|uniref:Cytochrome bc complex cytochrome b subunit n=1 Tax=Lysobacter korlensis TaxID=553636 RepID=A0ABV6S099_9GAMM